jgi:hypothetical protein
MASGEGVIYKLTTGRILSNEDVMVVSRLFSLFEFQALVLIHVLNLEGRFVESIMVRQR